MGRSVWSSSRVTASRAVGGALWIVFFPSWLYLHLRSGPQISMAAQTGQKSLYFGPENGLVEPGGRAGDDIQVDMTFYDDEGPGGLQRVRTPDRTVEPVLDRTDGDLREERVARIFIAGL